MSPNIEKVGSGADMYYTGTRRWCCRGCQRIENQAGSMTTKGNIMLLEELLKPENHTFEDGCGLVLMFPELLTADEAETVMDSLNLTIDGVDGSIVQRR